MPKNANQKLKLLYLMKILLEATDENHGLTLAQITQSLAANNIIAERKSLYDDIEALRLFGLDIIKTKTGRSVDYRVVNRDFQLPELKLLVDAVQSSKFITRKKSDELIKKLEGFCSKHEASLLHRQVFVSNRIKAMNESVYLVIDHIHTAINENRQIEFKYFEWNAKKEKVFRHNGATYHVSPWALTRDDENYYLIAFDSAANTIKHYRVDKMTSVSVSELAREGHEKFKNFDTAIYSNKTFGMFGGKEETVRLRCRNQMANVIIDRFGREPVLTDCGNGCFEITVKVAVSPLFVSWVMNFGQNIKVISPQSVIDEIKKNAALILEQY